MGVTDADRTLEDREATSNDDERPTPTPRDDDDAAGAMRTVRVAPMSPQVADALLSESAAPSPEGTQEIRAEDVLEVLEGRQPADRTQEIRAADILEELAVDPPPPVSVAVRSARPQSLPRLQRASADVAIPIDEGEIEHRPSSKASSIAPLSIEVPEPFEPRRRRETYEETTSDASFAVRVGPPRRLRAIVEIAMAASLLILAAGAVRAHLSSGEPETPPIVLVPPPGAASPPPAAVDVKSLPTTPTTGTLARTSSAKLTVDGAVITGSSAIVPCGAHVIRLGNEKPRNVDVPCGGTVSIDRLRR